MSEVVEYQRLRIEALENELKRFKTLFTEVSEVSTAKARDISVIINDPAFLEPISNLEKTY